MGWLMILGTPDIALEAPPAPLTGRHTMHKATQTTFPTRSSTTLNSLVGCMFTRRSASVYCARSLAAGTVANSALTSYTCVMVAVVAPWQAAKRRPSLESTTTRPYKGHGSVLSNQLVI